LEQIVRCPQEKNETVILYYRSDWLEKWYWSYWEKQAQ
jgi:hypothetical protein